MAESVEKDRELERRLTTDVAHELRTPLMAIQSTVEAMVDGVFEADQERLETVNSEVQRLGRLVSALLSLSRLENRSTPMKEEVVDVGELISSIVATHEAFVADSGLTLTYEMEKNVLVKGDADMIRQATANLISNAVRYTSEGGHITVKRLARRHHGGDLGARHRHRPDARGVQDGVLALLARRRGPQRVPAEAWASALPWSRRSSTAIADGCRSRVRRTKAPASRSTSRCSTPRRRRARTGNRGAPAAKSRSRPRRTKARNRATAGAIPTNMRDNS